MIDRAGVIEGELAARRTWRLIAAALALGIVCSSAVLITLRAQAETRPAASPRPAGQPQGGEIRDDPTVAPDVHESADDNVSFPVDI